MLYFQIIIAVKCYNLFYCRLRSMVIFALTLARHGETGHNKNNVIQGQKDVPLSATGIQQAKALGIHLKHQQYTRIYISDLIRAKQTADVIMKQIVGFSGQSIYDSRLRERGFGNIEGRSFKYLKYAAESAGQKIGDYTPPGGETLQQVYERVLSFFQELCQTVINECNEYEDQAVKNNLFSSTSYNNAKKTSGESYNSEELVVPSTDNTLLSDNDDISFASKTMQCNKYINVSSFLTQESQEQRVSVCSSNDDDDKVEMVANILVVTHGGFIRELLRYFVEELNCSIPGGKHLALRISPNAALSKFSISVKENKENPKIICHQIHDKHYLLSDHSKKESLKSVDDSAL